MESSAWTAMLEIDAKSHIEQADTRSRPTSTTNQTIIEIESIIDATLLEISADSSVIAGNRDRVGSACVNETVELNDVDRKAH